MNSAITRLPILIVNVHSRCNCRCAMCDIWRNDVNQEFAPDRLRAQLSDMVRLGVEWVVFSGGEPLMHSRLFELCGMLKPLGIRVSILTTGLLLARYAKQVSESLDDVVVSLDGPPPIHDRIRGVPGAFEKLREGIRSVRALRPEFKIHGRCTVQKLNHALLGSTLAAALDLGLTSLSFLAADLTSQAFRRDPPWPEERQNEIALTASELNALEEVVEELIAARDPLLSDSDEHLRRIGRHFRAHLGLADACSPRCNAPWVSAVIDKDGAVRPCFFHQPVGHLGAGTLETALNNPAALTFRDQLRIEDNPTCRNCVCSLHRQ